MTTLQKHINMDPRTLYIDEIDSELKDISNNLGIGDKIEKMKKREVGRILWHDIVQFRCPAVASPGCSYWGGRGERRRRETSRGVRGNAPPEKNLFVGSLKRYFPHFQTSFMII